MIMMVVAVQVAAEPPTSGIDFTGLGAALSPVAGIIIAIGTVLLNRQKQRIVDTDDLEQELELCSTVRGVAMKHIRTLERGYADLGADPPARPPELSPGYYGRVRPGRHRGNAGDAKG